MSAVAPASYAQERETADGLSTGTGFILAPSNYVATNYHVIEDAQRIELSIPGYAVTTATVVIRDAINDLAILRPDRLESVGTSLPAVLFADPARVRIGQDTLTLGYPLGSLMGSTVRLSTGTINSLYGMYDDPRVYQISNPIQPGNSGSPLFDRDGQLIGIVVSQLDAKALYEKEGIIPQNVNFAVKASFLKNLVDALPNTPKSVGVLAPLKGLSREDLIARVSPLIARISTYRSLPPPPAAAAPPPAPPVPTRNPLLLEIIAVAARQ